MQVRVKEGQNGFIYGVYRTEGTEFTLKSVKKTDGKTLTIKQQFSDSWMEEIKTPKAKPAEIETEKEDAEAN